MAILPIAILWFGTGSPAALSIVAYAAFFPIIVNTVPVSAGSTASWCRPPPPMGCRAARADACHPAGGAAEHRLGRASAMGVAWTAIVAAELAVGAKSGGGGSGGIGQMMFVFYAYSVELNGIVVCMIVVGGGRSARSTGCSAWPSIG